MITIDVKGLDQLKAKYDKLPTEVQAVVRASVEDGAKVFVRNAKRDAPVDHGFLRNMIAYAPLVSDKTHCTFEVISNAAYSPYLEWGTITRVSVPAELQGYAIEFKGKGLRKNGGIYPHPFFFRQIPVVKGQIERDVKDLLERL